MLITYGTDNQRIKSVLKNNGNIIETKYYTPGYEKEVTTGSTRELHYVNSPYGLAAILIKQGGNTTTYFTETDHLGSIVGLINADGSYAEQFSYDPWGRRRNPLNWTFTSVPQPVLITRGFTGHEHLDNFGLIDMNGRMYDPVLARFLGVDHIIQAADNSQSINGYGYCLNNPLKYIDPSGYRYTYQDYLRDNMASQQEPGAEYFNNYPFGWSDYVSYTASSHHGDLTFHYNWETGVYTDNRGRKVSFEEVQRKYLAPYVNESWDFQYFVLGEGKPNLLVATKRTGADFYGRFKINIQIIGNDFPKYNWVQTANYWDLPTKEWLGYKIDPSDVNHGFYYDDKIYEEEKKWYQGSESAGYFNDTPNGWQFKAELTLCGFRNGQWEVIQDFRWEYSLVGQSYDFFEKVCDPLPTQQKWVKSAIDYWNNH
jgi:RHS repeat-associated protein